MFLKTGRIGTEEAWAGCLGNKRKLREELPLRGKILSIGSMNHVTDAMIVGKLGTTRGVRGIFKSCELQEMVL